MGPLPDQAPSHPDAPRLVGRQEQVWCMQGTEVGTRAIRWGTVPEEAISDLLGKGEVARVQ